MAQSAKSEAGRWAACFDELAGARTGDRAGDSRPRATGSARTRAAGQGSGQVGLRGLGAGRQGRRQHVQHHGRKRLCPAPVLPRRRAPRPQLRARRHRQRHAPPQGPLQSTATRKKPCARSSRPPSRCTPASSRVLKNPNASALSLPPRCGGRCHVVAEGGPAVQEQIRHAVASAPQPPSAFGISPRGAGGERGAPTAGLFQQPARAAPPPDRRRVGNHRRCN